MSGWKEPPLRTCLVCSGTFHPSLFLSSDLLQALCTERRGLCKEGELCVIGVLSHTLIYSLLLSYRWETTAPRHHMEQGQNLKVSHTPPLIHQQILWALLSHCISNLVTLPLITVITLARATFLSDLDHHNHFSMGPLASTLVPCTAVALIFDSLILLCSTFRWVPITFGPKPNPYHGRWDSHRIVPLHCPALQTHGLTSSLCSWHYGDTTQHPAVSCACRACFYLGDLAFSHMFLWLLPPSIPMKLLSILLSCPFGPLIALSTTSYYIIYLFAYISWLLN